MFEYFVPIQSSATIDGDFNINGIAINETTTSNGHKSVGEELEKSSHTLIGVPLLKDHDNSVDSIVGKVNRAHWDESLRNIPFNAIVKDHKMIQLIKDGLLTSVSVGADVRPEDIEELDNGDVIPHNIIFRELSLVAVGADNGATFSNAFNEAYKSYSTKVDSIERRNNMKENEETETVEPTETKEEPKEAKEEPKEEVEEPKEEVSEEEKKVDEKIAKLRLAAKKKKLALMEADADEKPAEEPKKEKKKEESKEEPEEEEEESEEETEEVEEKGDYKFTSGYNSFGIERKSYVYS